MFIDVLSEIANRVENTGCILLLGMDGLPIEKVVVDEAINVEALMAEFPTLIKVTNSTTNEMNAGIVDELIVLSNQMILLTKSITSEYFLLMAISKDGNIGKARFELKKAKYALEKEFV